METVSLFPLLIPTESIIQHIINKRKSLNKTSPEKNKSSSLYLPAGNRNYLFEIKKASSDTRYLRIQEISEIENQENNKTHIIVFEEYFDEFISSLHKLLQVKPERNKSYSLNEIRKDHPNAYEKWTKEDDELLIKSYQDGLTISELSIIFERKVGAIQSRLKKLAFESQLKNEAGSKR